MRRRMFGASVFGLGLWLTVAVAGLASAQTPTFTPAPWKDCSANNCKAGEAVTYLLWSRVSDGNDCKTLLSPSLGIDAARTQCNALTKGGAPAPIDELGVVNGLKQFFAAQTATAPLASASVSIVNNSQGFPSERSYGSLFAERPLTAGRGRQSFSFGYQHTEWSSVDGTSLSDIHTEENSNSSPRSPSWCALDSTYCPSLRWTTDLHLVTDSWTVGYAIGLTNSIDLSVDAPVVRVAVSGSTWDSNNFSPSVPQGVVLRSATASGTSWGIGDLSFRGKWALPPLPLIRKTDKVHLAVAGLVRAPTGNAEEFIGLGAWQEQIMLVGAFNAKPLPNQSAEAIPRGVGVHANFGYTWAGSGIAISNVSPGNSNQIAGDFDIHPSNSLDYTLGADVPVWPKQRGVSLSFDVIGRRFSDTAIFHDYGFIGATGRYELQPFLFEQAHLTRYLWTAGVKFRPFDAPWLIVAQYLGPSGTTGLQPQYTLIFGAQYAR